MAFQDSSKNSVLYYYLAPSVPPPPPPPPKNKIPREGVAEDFPLLFRSQKLLQGPCCLHDHRRRIWQTGNTDTNIIQNEKLFNYLQQRKNIDLVIEAPPPGQCCRLEPSVPKHPLQIFFTYFHNSWHDSKISYAVSAKREINMDN